jgi:hypothetical protein
MAGKPDREVQVSLPLEPDVVCTCRSRAACRGKGRQTLQHDLSGALLEIDPDHTAAEPEATRPHGPDVAPLSAPAARLENVEISIWREGKPSRVVQPRGHDIDRLCLHGGGRKDNGAGDTCTAEVIEFRTSPSLGMGGKVTISHAFFEPATGGMRDADAG